MGQLNGGHPAILADLDAQDHHALRTKAAGNQRVRRLGIEAVLRSGGYPASATVA